MAQMSQNLPPSLQGLNDPMQTAQSQYMNAAQGGQNGAQDPMWSKWFQMMKDANGGVQPVMGTGGKGTPSLASLPTDAGAPSASAAPWSQGTAPTEPGSLGGLTPGSINAAILKKNQKPPVAPAAGPAPTIGSY